MFLISNEITIILYFTFLIIVIWAINSAGECHPYTVEAAGSIPASPKKKQFKVIN